MKTTTEISRGSREVQDIKRTRRPSHPGALLRDILEGLEMSQGDAAKTLGVGIRTVNELVNEKRGVGAEMALRLSRAFGSSPKVWLGLQIDVDLWDAERSAKAREIERTVARVDAVGTGGGSARATTANRAPSARPIQSRMASRANSAKANKPRKVASRPRVKST